MKRYDVDYVDNDYTRRLSIAIHEIDGKSIGMSESKLGDWVKYDDVIAILQEAKKIKEEKEAFDKMYREIC